MEFCRRDGDDALDVVEGDHVRALRRVPCMLAELLQEIGQAIGHLQDQFEGTARPHDPLVNRLAVDVMDLVHRDLRAGVVVAHNLPKLDEQPGEVGGEVARVGGAVDRLNVNTQLGTRLGA